MTEQDQKDVGGPELRESLTALGQFVLSEQSLQESLQRVAELCVRAMYGADGAGVTWVVAREANALHAQQCRVIVDLTDVTFMDSSGLNVLVLARRKAEAGRGELRLAGACGMVRKVLQMTRLEQVFPVHSTIEESIGLGPAVPHITIAQLPQTEYRG